MDVALAAAAEVVSVQFPPLPKFSFCVRVPNKMMSADISQCFCFSARRRDHHQRSSAEQLDYEMELHRAQREGREEEFKEEERKKMRVRAAARLDAEMDEYFKDRPSKDGENGTDGADAKKSDDRNGESAEAGSNGTANGDEPNGKSNGKRDDMDQESDKPTDAHDKSGAGEVDKESAKTQPEAIEN